MKKNLLLLFALFAVSGCSDDKEGVISIYDRNREVIVSENMRSLKTSFRANKGWHISIDEIPATAEGADWIEVFPMSGKAGNMNLDIKILYKNLTANDRKAKLVIRAEDGSEGIITVTQRPVGSGVRISKISTNESGEEKEYRLTYDDKGRLTSFGDDVILTYQKISSGDGNAMGTLLTIEWEPDSRKNKDRSASYTGSSSCIVYDSCATSLSPVIAAYGLGPDEGAYGECDFSYHSGTKMLYRVKRPGEGNADILFKWGLGNIAEIVWDRPADPQGENNNTILKLTYNHASRPNNYYPLNLWAYLVKSEFDYYQLVDFINMRGERSRHLPSKIEGRRTLNFAYTAGQHGYITKVDVEVEGNAEENFTVNITY